MENYAQSLGQLLSQDLQEECFEKLQEFKTLKISQMFQHAPAGMNLYILWHLGLPHGARISIWPLVIGNNLQVSSMQVQQLELQFEYLLRSVSLSLDTDGLTPSSEHYLNEELFDQLVEEEEDFLCSFLDKLLKVSAKVKKLKFHADFASLDKQTFSEILFQGLMLFYLHRPDISYFSSLAGIFAQLVALMLPRSAVSKCLEQKQQYEGQDQLFQLENEQLLLEKKMDFVREALRTFENMVLGTLPQQIIFFQSNMKGRQMLSMSSHLPAFFQKQEDEIHWRCQFFDQQFAAIIPDLEQHFQGIELKSQFYLYEWLESLFIKVLPQEVLLRVWDMFFLKGEVFLYQCALGILKFLKSMLMGQSSQDCQQAFQQLRKGSFGLKEDGGDRFFATVYSIPLSVEQFVVMREAQLQAYEKGHIFQIYQ